MRTVNGIYILCAHAHRHGASMGTYGTSQGGGLGGGGLGDAPHLGYLPLRALVLTGPLRAGYRVWLITHA